MSGTLAVTGASTLTGNVTLGGSLTDGTATLDGSGAWTGITSLTVDNLVLNGNTMSASSGAINITPAAGSAIVLDGAVNVDAGVVTGVTDLTMSGTLDLGTNTISDGAFTGNWDFATGNITTGGIIKIDVDGTAENAAGSLTMGAGNDAGIFFDGTDLVLITNGSGASGIVLDSEDDTIELKGSGTTQATFSTSGLNLVAGDGYSIGGTSVLNATTLGSGVTASSLTSVGTLTSLTISSSSSPALSVTQTSASNFAIDATNSGTNGNLIARFNGSDTSTTVTDDTGPRIIVKNTSNTNNNYSQIDFHESNGNTSCAVIGRNVAHGGSPSGSIHFLTKNAGTTKETEITIDGDIDLASGATFDINGTTVLSSNTLGSGVTASSLTSVGTLTDLQVSTTEIPIITNTEAAEISLRVWSTNASLTGNVLQSDATRAANSGYNLCRMRSGDGADVEFQFSGDGNGTCDGSWTGGGADYAEYFETA